MELKWSILIAADLIGAGINHRPCPHRVTATSSTSLFTHLASGGLLGYTQNRNLLVDRNSTWE